jgi:c-di-GMP-binding flagellar brake protein YcgR
MMRRTELSEPCNQYIERRRTLRVDAPTELTVQILTAPLPARVCNVSAEGFQVAACVPFQPGARHRVRFLCGDWSSRVLTAVSIHSRREFDTASFITGFQFLEGTEAAAEVVDRISASITVL